MFLPTQMMSPHRFLASTFCIALPLLVVLARPTAAQPVDSTKLEAMAPRQIGPAGMSGRVTAIEAVESNPDIVYAGTASGGLWKSADGGTTWNPIFDDQPVHSIGSIAIDQDNPDVIWVGTGEGNPRNSQNAGDGVFRSMDGGRTWTRVGLRGTRSIHRLLIHPDNSDIAYAGAQGATWGPTAERGVYKTTDGGATWEQILFVNDTTGVADLVMDPQNPNKLIAAMWQYQRWPHYFESGGPGSGLYMTFDGGDTWDELTPEDGLPPKPWGRIGLAIAPSDPSRVYAYVESEDNALYRSDDGGHSWQPINSDMDEIGGRPFYYADLRVDPANENRLYSLHSIVTYSVDGGESFETLVPYAGVHPDHHAWWIHPDDPSLIYEGNDGGFYISRDRGENWRFVENLPLAQFYHINVDMAMPYHVYGGMQDNGSWRGPSAVWRNGGIRNTYWQEVAFGDGFDVVPDPQDATKGYAMSQGGNLVYYDSETGHQRFSKPTHPDPDTDLRFNWNAAIAQSPHDPATIYYGSQFVHQSTDRGHTWDIISPDLTTNNPEWQRQLESGGLTYDVTNAENYTTITAIAPSPAQEGVLWAGTDDGNVQVTRDGGENWTNVIDHIDGVPANTWVQQIRASRRNPGEAFVVFDNHRRNDWTPYVYHTTDYGDSWDRLVGEDDVHGYALSFVQDPREPNLMFVGTEFGLYYSLDGGDSWTPWTSGFPTASVIDLQIHPREHDLIIGTFGRSAYVLDDIRPLRAMAREGTDLLDAPLHVFDAPDAYLATYNEAPGTRFIGDAVFVGENRPYGALLSFVVNPPENEDAEMPEEITMQIVNAAGDTIRTVMVDDLQPGINRTSWNLERKGVRFPSEPEPDEEDAEEPSGPEVIPGTYTVVLSHGEHTASTDIRVRMDPRIPVDMDALQARQDMMDRFMNLVEDATAAADRLRDAQSAIDLVENHLEEHSDTPAANLREQSTAMRDSIETLMEGFTGRDDVQGIRRDPSIVTAHLYTVSRYLQSAFDAPEQPEQRAMQHAEVRLQRAIDNVNAFFAEEWPAYRSAVEEADLSIFEDYAPLQMGQ
jgi:photosystem II stability/assembly factor-like uncharacterized protein